MAGLCNTAGRLEAVRSRTPRHPIHPAVPGAEAPLCAYTDAACAHQTRGDQPLREGMHKDVIPAKAGTQKGQQVDCRKPGGERVASKKRDTAARKDPACAVVQLNPGLLYGETGEYARAMRAFEHALEADPSMHTAAYNLAVLYGKGKDWTKAVRFMEIALEVQPHNDKYVSALQHFAERRDGRRQRQGRY